MAYYRSLGNVPKKRHVQHRRESGEFYYEELMGEEGFSSDSSLLYHKHIPSSILAAEVWEAGAGVCQDIAHLTLGALRHIGIPARYVSGYVETSPPPGQEKLEGSDASHAWTSVLVPGGEWIDLDPTNDHFADSRYIVTAWGRDFRDVSPLKGVIYTESKKSKLEVKVDVFRVNADGTLS